MQHLQAIAAVGHVGEERGIGGGDNHILRVIELAVGVVELIELRGFGFFDVDDGEPLRAGGDIGVGAGEVDALGV